MHVFQTDGLPPSRGRTILAIIGWTRNSIAAPVKIVMAKTGSTGETIPDSGGATVRTSPMASPFFSPERRFDAVICDIDGCLAPESSAPFDIASLARVAGHNRMAQERRDRPVVTVCSGRPEPFAEAMCRLIQNSSLPAIAENGVWMYFPDANRYDRDPRITREHLAAVHAAAAWVERELGPQGVVMQPGKSCSISLYHSDTAFLTSLEPVVRLRFEREGWPLRMSMTWLYINCDLQHMTKGTALER